jgi:16S rRNA (guanine527-N7)-methyltransferase
MPLPHSAGTATDRVASASRDCQNGDVTTDALADRIIRRGLLAGLEIDARRAEALVAYVRLLTRWNRRINLTALPLEPLRDEALDRLVVEPMAGATFVRSDDRTLLDIGSGAGSPAIPLKLGCPWMRLVMVEARARKSAFLREAIRHLDLPDSVVETRVFGRAPADDRSFDVISVRAVRLDTRLTGAVAAALSPGGRVLVFGGQAGSPGQMNLLREEAERQLPGGSRLVVLGRP